MKLSLTLLALLIGGFVTAGPKFSRRACTESRLRVDPQRCSKTLRCQLKVLENLPCAKRERLSCTSGAVLLDAT
jgi:hypothetical protein